MARDGWETRRLGEHPRLLCRWVCAVYTGGDVARGPPIVAATAFPDRISALLSEACSSRDACAYRCDGRSDCENGRGRRGDLFHSWRLGAHFHFHEEKGTARSRKQFPFRFPIFYYFVFCFLIPLDRSF